MGVSESQYEHRDNNMDKARKHNYSASKAVSVSTNYVHF